MGETPDIRPVWRTRLAAVLVAWIAVALSVTLTAPRLLEVTPPQVTPFLLGALYVAPPPLLLVWSFWAMMREPVTGWLAPTVLMAFCGAFVPLAPLIYDAGVRLNFESRRPVYEAVAAEVREGRIAGEPNARGWIVGERDGVRYRFRPTDRGMVDFNWMRAYGFTTGVRYDDTPCISRPGALCIDRGEPLAERYAYYARFF